MDQTRYSYWETEYQRMKHNYIDSLFSVNCSSNINWEERKIYSEYLDLYHKELIEKIGRCWSYKNRIVKSYPFKKQGISKDEYDRIIESNMLKMEDRLRSELPSIFIGFKISVVNREEEKKEQEIADQIWAEMSLPEKIIVSNTSKEIKKPSTLIEGWIIFITLMIVESMFYGACGAWIITIIGFIIWRKREIDKYN